MSDLTDAQKLAMARQIAVAMNQMMAGVPDQIALEASIILMKSRLLGSVRHDKRLQLFGSVSQRIRAEIKVHNEKERKS